MKKNSVVEVIVESVRKKLSTYSPESSHMPFHHRLLGKDKMALYSFIHSLNTNFGTSIFEPVAVALAEQNPATTMAQRHYQVNTQIGEKTQQCIQGILNELSVGEELSDKVQEIDRIRKAAQRNQKTHQIKHTKVDLMVKDKNDHLFLIDLKTAKPNKDGFKGLKRTLLEWAASEIHRDAGVKVHTLIAIPYNPYHPKPYERWTMKGMLDLKEELKVGTEFWDFLASKSVYEPLLTCFETAGKVLSHDLDGYFDTFQSRNTC